MSQFIEYKTNAKLLLEKSKTSLIIPFVFDHLFYRSNQKLLKHWDVSSYPSSKNEEIREKKEMLIPSWFTLLFLSLFQP